MPMLAMRSAQLCPRLVNNGSPLIDHADGAVAVMLDLVQPIRTRRRRAHKGRHARCYQRPSQRPQGLGLAFWCGDGSDVSIIVPLSERRVGAS